LACFFSASSVAFGSASVSANRTGSPERAAQAAAGGGEAGLAQRRQHDRLGWRAEEAVAQVGDRRGDRGRVFGFARAAAADRFDPGQRVGDERRAEGEATGATRRLAPLRVERGERFFARLGGRFGAGEEEWHADRRRHQDRGSDCRQPVVFGNQSDGRRPLRGRDRGEDGEGDGGGVFGRGGAADPGRVVGREGRIAEAFAAFRGRRLLFAVFVRRFLGDHDRRRAGTARARLVIGAAAGTGDEDEDDETDRDDDEAADQQQRPRHARPARRFRFLRLIRRGLFRLLGKARGGFLRLVPLGDVGIDRSVGGHPIRKVHAVQKVSRARPLRFRGLAD